MFESLMAIPIGLLFGLGAALLGKTLGKMRRRSSDKALHIDEDRR
jgi:hypothetical protein